MPARYRGWEAAEEELDVLDVLDVLEIEFPRPDEVGLVLVVTGGVDEPERVEVETVELELDGPGLDELDELEELDALEALEELDDPEREVEVVVEVELVVELEVEICIGTP